MAARRATAQCAVALALAALALLGAPRQAPALVRASGVEPAAVVLESLQPSTGVYTGGTPLHLEGRGFSLLVSPQCVFATAAPGPASRLTADAVVASDASAKCAAPLLDGSETPATRITPACVTLESAPAAAPRGAPGAALVANASCSTPALPFTYYADPHVGSISPRGAPRAQRALVNVSGSGFLVLADAGIEGNPMCAFSSGADYPIGYVPARVLNDTLVQCRSPSCDDYPGSTYCIVSGDATEGFSFTFSANGVDYVSFRDHEVEWYLFPPLDVDGPLLPPTVAMGHPASLNVSVYTGLLDNVLGDGHGVLCRLGDEGRQVRAERYVQGPRTDLVCQFSAADTVALPVGTVQLQLALNMQNFESSSGAMVGVYAEPVVDAVSPSSGFPLTATPVTVAFTGSQFDTAIVAAVAEAGAALCRFGGSGTVPVVGTLDSTSNTITCDAPPLSADVEARERERAPASESDTAGTPAPVDVPVFISLNGGAVWSAASDVYFTYTYAQPSPLIDCNADGSLTCSTRSASYDGTEEVRCATGNCWHKRCLCYTGWEGTHCETDARSSVVGLTELAQLPKFSCDTEYVINTEGARDGVRVMIVLVGATLVVTLMLAACPLRYCLPAKVADRCKRDVLACLRRADFKLPMSSDVAYLRAASVEHSEKQREDLRRIRHTAARALVRAHKGDLGGDSSDSSDNADDHSMRTGGGSSMHFDAAASRRRLGASKAPAEASGVGGGGGGGGGGEGEGEGEGEHRDVELARAVRAGDVVPLRLVRRGARSAATGFLTFVLIGVWFYSASDAVIKYYETSSIQTVVSEVAGDPRDSLPLEVSFGFDCSLDTGRSCADVGIFIRPGNAQSSLGHGTVLSCASQTDHGYFSCECSHVTVPNGRACVATVASDNQLTRDFMWPRMRSGSARDQSAEQFLYVALRYQDEELPWPEYVYMSVNAAQDEDASGSSVLNLAVDAYRTISQYDSKWCASVSVPRQQMVAEDDNAGVQISVPPPLLAGRTITSVTQAVAGTDTTSAQPADEHAPACRWVGQTASFTADNAEAALGKRLPGQPFKMSGNFTMRVDAKRTTINFENSNVVSHSARLTPPSLKQWDWPTHGPPVERATASPSAGSVGVKIILDPTQTVSSVLNDKSVGQLGLTIVALAGSYAGAHGIIRTLFARAYRRTRVRRAVDGLTAWVVGASRSPRVRRRAAAEVGRGDDSRARRRPLLDQNGSSTEGIMLA